MTLVIDRGRGFVGAFNLPPAGTNLNAEIDVIFTDPGLAHVLRNEYLRLNFRTELPGASWQEGLTEVRQCQLAAAGEALP